MLSCANPGASTVSTLLPTIAASIIAVVLIPTTAALCASESKKSARASSVTTAVPSRGQTATLPKRERSTSRQWSRSLGWGRTAIPIRRSRSSPEERSASIHPVTKPDSALSVIAGFEHV